MPQASLPFQYAEENRSSGMTALSGLAAYLEMAEAAGLRDAIRRHITVREKGQGWSDVQMVMSLLLLNLAGGESVEDLRILEADEGLGRVLAMSETHRMRSAERIAQARRWRRVRSRSVPSPSAVFRYLSGFHDPSEEEIRQPHTAFIPRTNDALVGLGGVNADFVEFVNSHTHHTEATLDMDATLIETHKREATYCYRKYRAYQPLTTYWSEADLIVHSEFRDGNVPAGHEQLRVLRESLGYLPSGVARVMMRSDSAGYAQELLRYCAEGRDERFGVIEFAVGVDVTTAFRQAVSETADNEWHKLYRRVGEDTEYTGQQYAEVCFVPNWVGHSRNSPEYRYLAIRELLRKPPLPGMDAQLELSVPTMEMSDGAWYKIGGIVTNRDMPADELIWWYRQRCGKGEEVHAVLKTDLAGGRLPSGLFGTNAAWWAISVLAFNLNSAVKQLVLGDRWVSKRLKAIRYGIICIPGCVVRHARRLTIRLPRGHPSFELLVGARRGTLALAN